MARTGPQGCYGDRIVTETGETIDLGWRSNLIVDGCRVMLATRMRVDRSTGIQMLLVGRGLDEWDSEPPLPASRETNSLVDPNPFRIILSAREIRYLRADGTLSNAPTSRLQITATLEPGEPPISDGDDVPLREFGLFGKVRNRRTMLNYVRHPVIHKKAGDRLVRTIRLEF